MKGANREYSRGKQEHGDRVVTGETEEKHEVAHVTGCEHVPELVFIGRVGCVNLEVSPM